MKLENVTCEDDLSKTQKAQLDFALKVDISGVNLSENVELSGSDHMNVCEMIRESFGYSYLNTKKVPRKDYVPLTLESMDPSDLKSFALKSYIEGYRIREKLIK